MADIDISLSDAITVSESRTITKILLINKSESISVSEWLDVLVGDTRAISVNDSITLVDWQDTLINSTRAISVNDSITLTEYINGATFYAGTQPRFEYRLEHRDTDGNLIERLEGITTTFNFEYSRIGGDGSFEMSIKREFLSSPLFEADDDIRLYVRRADENDFQIWYRGLVQNYAPSLTDQQAWTIRGTGYLSQLERLLVTETYELMSVEAIVRDILDNYVVGQTGIDITYNDDDIEEAGLILEQINFDDSVINAFKKLADIVGKREWGVDSNAQFFFKERTNQIAFVLVAGADLVGYDRLDDFDGIINRIEVRGGRLEDGTIYQLQVNNLVSQTQFGLRTKVFNNSSIKNESDANRYAQAVMQDTGNIVRRARIALNADIRFFHEIKPLGLFQVGNLEEGLNRAIYGVPLYGGGEFGSRYAGIDSYQPDSFKYTISEAGSGLDVIIDLGNQRPELFNSLARLDFGLENIRQR